MWGPEPSPAVIRWRKSGSQSSRDRDLSSQRNSDGASGDNPGGLEKRGPERRFLVPGVSRGGCGERSGPDSGKWHPRERPSLPELFRPEPALTSGNMMNFSLMEKPGRRKAWSWRWRWDGFFFPVELGEKGGRTLSFPHPRASCGGGPGILTKEKDYREPGSSS